MKTKINLPAIVAIIAVGFLASSVSSTSYATPESTIQDEHNFAILIDKKTLSVDLETLET